MCATMQQGLSTQTDPACRQKINAFVFHCLEIMILKCQVSSHLFRYNAWFVSDLVRNSEDRFSGEESHTLFHKVETLLPTTELYMLQVINFVPESSENVPRRYWYHNLVQMTVLRQFILVWYLLQVIKCNIAVVCCRFSVIAMFKCFWI